MIFHNIKTIITLFSVCMSLSISTPANACAESPAEAPAKESKTYRNVNVGFSFSIPSNYKVMGSKDSVSILNPSTYKYHQCIVKNKIRTESPLESFTVSVTPIRLSNASLRDLVIKAMPWIETEGFGFRTVNFLGKQSLVFSQYNGVDDTNMNYTSFLSRDRRYLIIIHGPEKDRELKKALATFKFN
jgi:hypothetical protein